MARRSDIDKAWDLLMARCADGGAPDRHTDAAYLKVAAAGNNPACDWDTTIPPHQLRMAALKYEVLQAKEAEQAARYPHGMP